MIATLLMALALQGSLDTQAREFHCNDPQTQLDMNQCAGIDFQRADIELNRVWREAIAAARQDDAGIAGTNDRRQTEEAQLREAQRGWLVFRDAECTVEGYREARGGSMEPLIYNGCRARLTRERTAQLRPQPNER